MGWIKSVGSTFLVVVFALGVGLLVGSLRSSGPGGGLIPNLITTVPADGARDVPITGQIEIHYSVRPSVDPTVKLEPVAGVTLSAGYWEGTTFIIPYAGLRPGRTYHAELDQDSRTGKGEHKQLKYRWSFTTGSRTTEPNPTATPTSTSVPSIHSQPPTATGPLIWYWGGGRLIAVDWQGTDGVGQLMLSPALQSPDGSFLWYRDPPAPPPSGSVTPVFDRTGSRIGTLNEDPTAIWGDGNQQVCSVTGNSDSTVGLYVQAPGGPLQKVVALPAGGSPAACSWMTGRAVVVLRPNYIITGIEVVQLIERRVLYQQTYPNPPAWVSASRDGRYAAEVYGWPSSNTSPVPGASPGMTMIRDLTSGQVVAQLPNFDAHGFSWDGSLVVGVVGGAGNVAEIQVRNWQTGAGVWHLRYPGNITSVPGVDLRVLPRPNGGDLAVAFPYAAATGSPWDLYVVHPDGSAKYVLRAPITPAF